VTNELNAAGDWLKPERTAWGKLLDSGLPQTRLTIVATLSHWKEDSDLAGIRDAEALARLPADKQKAFTRLWPDVAVFLEKAAEKPKWLRSARAASQTALLKRSERRNGDVPLFRLEAA
jgi:hypothetical protein